MLEFKLINSTNSLPLPKDGDDLDFEVTISARLTWSLHPDRPLTICTYKTPFDIGVDGKSIAGVGRCLSMTSTREPSKTLLGDPLRNHWVNVNIRPRDDYRKIFGFLTIPPSNSNSAVTIKKKITTRQLRILSPASAPCPGEEYDLIVYPPGHFALYWWNWGDLDGDLADKFLTDWPNRKNNTRDDENIDFPPENAVLPFASWEDDTDDEGNSFEWIHVKWDDNPLKVKFEG